MSGPKKRRADGLTRRTMLGGLLGTSASLFGLGGCAASFESGWSTDAATVTVHSVPPSIHSYPRVWYHGTYVYLVDSDWYAPRGSTWVRYRHEPVDLVRYRRHYHSRGRFPAHVYRSHPGSSRHRHEHPSHGRHGGRRRYDTQPRDTQPQDTQRRDTQPRDTQPRDTQRRDVKRRHVKRRSSDRSSRPSRPSRPSRHRRPQ